MNNFVSQSEFAILCNKTRQAISLRVISGDIKTVNGKISLDEYPPEIFSKRKRMSFSSLRYEKFVNSLDIKF